MELNHANQIAAMQENQTALHDKIVAMERDKSNNHSQMIDGKKVSLKDPLIKNKKDLQSLWKQTIGLMIQ